MVVLPVKKTIVLACEKGLVFSPMIMTVGKILPWGEFQLPLGNMKATNAFVPFNGDLANVNFTISS